MHQNISCGYSLELPQWGNSNEYHKVCFDVKITKKMHQNISCGYFLELPQWGLELPQWGNSNEYHKVCFDVKNCIKTYLVGTHWNCLNGANSNEYPQGMF